MFIPTTKKELNKLNWHKLDIIFITGDTYIDSSYNGVAILGKLLLKSGYKVGIIAQPDLKKKEDICRLGEPELFWAITSGSVDSMVANYTALKKRRKSDDLTPGLINNKRPDRAIIKYTNLIKQYYKNTKPIVIGGIEASLRRITHYDYWTNSLRKPILFNAKADILIYGMGEVAIKKLANSLKNNSSYKDIKGLSYISKTVPDNFITLPSFEQVTKNQESFAKMFELFFKNADPINSKGLAQQIDNRYLIQNPPNSVLSKAQLDEIYNLPFERDVHPFYKKQGKVKAMETTRFSITSHRGCYGNCHFCGIAIHQGSIVISRSEESIIKEVKEIVKNPDFKGYIADCGGPTANMYGFECQKKLKTGQCKNKNCLFPTTCQQLPINHQAQLKLLQRITKVKGVKKVFIASGIRHDLIIQDKKYGEIYLSNIIKNHISGQLKIAPEHTEDKILKLMNKPDKKVLTKFKSMFDNLTKKLNKNIYLTYYLIAAHPGSNIKDMQECKSFIKKILKINPQQVQIFTPLPSTYSALMYYIEQNPFTKQSIFVEKHPAKKEKQKLILINKTRR